MQLKFKDQINKCCKVCKESGLKNSETKLKKSQEVNVALFQIKRLQNMIVDKCKGKKN